MKKTISLITILVLVVSQLIAQKKPGYVKGGLSFFVGGTKTSDELTFFPAITIGPGFRLINTKEFSVSTELPISAGVCYNDNTFYFGIDVPASVNLNFGYGASDRSKAKFGWSAGVGKGYHYSYNEFYFDYDGDENSKLSLWGTLIQTSFFFRSKNSSDGGGSIRFYYLSNFSSVPVRKAVLGISLLTYINKQNNSHP
jgi:hypothetical protein